MKRTIILILVSIFSLLHAVYLHEGWDAGSFVTNAWVETPSDGNWQVMNASGYHLRFAGFPQVEDYDQCLVSKSFDISSVTSLSLEFMMKGIAIDPDSNESMAVEYSIDGSAWLSIFDVVAGPGDVMDPLDPYTYTFDTPITGSSMRFRFRAYGSDSSSLLFWRIDDIMLKDQNYQSPATITGSITDADMEPLANALVTDGQNYTRTGFSGTFTLEVQPSASLDLVATAFGYADASTELLNVLPEASLNHDFTMLPEDPAIMDPYRLQGFMNFGYDGPTVHLNWQSVHQFPGDGALELAHDNPPADYFYQPFMINECEYMVVRYERDWMLNIGAIKLALQSMMPTSVEIVAFYETDGQADLTRPVFSTPMIFDFVPQVPGYPQWQQFPLMLDIEPETPIYIGVRYRNGDLYSVGISQADDCHTYYSYDSENIWEPLTGEAAMIRLLGTEFEPWENRSFLGYNIYRNHVKQNDTPLGEPFYTEQNLAWGDYTYYVTALYDGGESNVSNSLHITASPVTISNVYASHNQDGESYSLVDIKAYQLDQGLSELSLYKNGTLICSWDDFDPDQSLIEALYQDHDQQNDTLVQYVAIAEYLDGSQIQSPIFEYRYLMGPSDLTALGCEEGVHLNWTAPVFADRDFLGYSISRSGNDDYIVFDELVQTTSFTDTGMAFGEVYDYIVSAVYLDGSADSNVASVVAGPPVYHPASGLTATVTSNVVQLSWQRPDDGFKIVGKDAPGTSEAFSTGETFRAYIHFAQGELMNVTDHNSVGLAFIPTTNDPLNISVFNCTDSENEYMCDQYMVEDIVPNQWNFSSCMGIWVGDVFSSYRIELETAGALMLDNASEPVSGANGLIVNGNMSDLATEYGIHQNWKFKLKFEENEVVGPVSRDLYPVLTHYAVHRDGESIAQLSEFDQYYEDSLNTSQSVSYYIVSIYDTGVSEPSDTVVVEPMANDEPHNNSPTSALTSYPNPFNPTTRICFSLASSAPVKLQVYNLRGQLVKTLHDGPLPSGNHAIEWNGTDANNRSISSGVYFLHMDDGSGVLTRKICLQK